MEGGKGKGSKDNGNGWKKEKLLRILQKLVFLANIAKDTRKIRIFTVQQTNSEIQNKKIVVKIGAKTKKYGLL